ncbi:MAG: hypothetical protein JWM07_267 [Candidatus Saccharibacteria bacterium]|nr:hypothetical protein [Candidatus Saccharibacteria bacterium]
MPKTTIKLNSVHGNFVKLLGLSAIGVVLVGLFFSLSVRADGMQVIVKATDVKGWYPGDIKEGGAVTYFGDSTSPYPTGVLALTTDATPGAKAQYLKSANIPLAQVTDLSYYTKNVSGPANAGVSYQLNINLHGIPDWTTAFVFDPSSNGQVVAGQWQKWDVYNGRFWSNDSVPPIVVIGAGNEPFYTLNELKAAYPDAIVHSFGVYAGTFNPDYNVGTSKQNLNLLADGITFNGVNYDFEAAPTLATSKDQCKNGGWVTFQNAYKNQGECVSSITSR